MTAGTCCSTGGVGTPPGRLAARQVPEAAYSQLAEERLSHQRSNEHRLHPAQAEPFGGSSPAQARLARTNARASDPRRS